MQILNNLIQIEKKSNIGLCGMTDEFFCAYINKLFNIKKRNIIIITSTLYEANKLYNNLKNYNDETLLFPMDEFLTSESIAISPELKSLRLDAMYKTSLLKYNILVCNLDGLLRFLPRKNDYIKSFLQIKKNNIIDRDILSNKLYKMGYIRQSVVTNTGEFAVRGFVIDIFPITRDHPIRIEFFDNEIDQLKEFNPETQKSFNNIDSVIITPNTEFLCEKDVPDEIKNYQKYLPEYTTNVESILDYLDNPIVILKDKSQINASYNNKIIEIEEYRKEKDLDFKNKYMFDLNSFSFNDYILYNTIDNVFDKLEPGSIFNFEIKSIPEFHENIDKINNYFEIKLLKNKTIIVCLKEFQINSFIKYINQKYVITSEYKIYENKINIVNFPMQAGFEYGKYVFITSKELFNRVIEPKYKTRFKYTSKIKSLSNLDIGDFVVHSTYGIAKYNGIKTLSKQGVKKDYLELLYAGSDKLYVPVEKIELIGKFTGKEGLVPKINKLGSTEWEKSKLRVRNRVHDIAKKLLEIYAKRKLKKGYAFSKDDEMQLLFDSNFEFTETPDQLRAIEQVKNDMESVEPMDRLLCGDVGYGKTEVAFRAMFKAVNDSKQVLYLCPTTILSNQQYNSALKRFSTFPVSIQLLNRFTPKKQAQKIISDLNDGKVDIVFGTHRLLSNDIKPKDLGLLIIDEEQRFGVIHKEKIKEYKENVDVLTLTATPIPRTLQMSLVGMRSLSLIETAPIDRYPVQTYVVEENKMLIRDAIYKEIGRNGQVFILYNNVKKIQEKANEISNLVPEAKVVYTHGQLNKNEIEDKMLSFINHEYDVMVCTTIIETGIDITNVNTLIIYNADQFGLSQLYQIRGRVGRSNKIGYAYLMYKKDKLLNPTAIKRLQAIKEFTELGSGFSIAARDLSIRGAGDILGSEQAGFIDTVGIDMFLKILNEEVERLKGNFVEEEKDTSYQNLLNVETHISDSYVSDEDLKIEIHKMINNIENYNDILNIKDELEDRFGRVSETIIIYMYEEWFESMARKININHVVQTDKSIEIFFDKEISSKLDGEKLFVDALKITRNFSFSYKNEKIGITLNLKGLEKHYIYYLTDLLNKIVLDIQ